MKKWIRILLVLLLLGFIISTPHLPVRSWLAGNLESFALKHADNLPLARIGEYLFDKNCAQCHDDPAMDAPAREVLASVSKENLMIAMEFGKMQPMAAHLSKNQRGLIALYLAGDSKDEYLWLDNAMCTQPAGPGQQLWATNWGQGKQNRRFVNNELTAINVDNVANLELAWSFAFPLVTDMRSQPVIIGDTMYIGDKAGKLFALDRFSGCVRQHIDILAGLRSAITLAELSDGRRLLIFANSLASVFAVDPDSFEIIWQKRVTISDYSVVTGSISFHDDRLFVPLSSYEVAAAGSPGLTCCTSHGAVTSLDAASGKELWTWHATVDASLQKTDADGKQHYGPSGAASWTTPTIDVKRGRIYIGTGQNLSPPATDTSDAIIALDISTGELVWKFQAIKGDVWNAACLNGGPNCPDNAGPDFDFGASVIIADLEDGQQVLLAGQKSGEIFALNPDPDGPTGEVMWRNRISQGTSNGGIHWGMALSGQRVFAAVSDPERDTSGYTPRPGLTALNITNGNILWQQPIHRGCDYDYSRRPLVGLENTRNSVKQDLTEQYKCSFFYGLSSAVTATSDLVFSAGLDGKIRAFQADNGEILWQTNTAIPFDAINGVSGHGGSIDVAGQVLAGDWLYVLSGYSMFGQLPGNVLLAYKLDN